MSGTPTVGRNVWFWRTSRGPTATKVLDAYQPFKADIIYVHQDGTVTVAGLDHAGTPYIAEGIALRDFADGDAHDLAAAMPPYATWPQLKIAPQPGSGFPFPPAADAKP